MADELQTNQISNNSDFASNFGRRLELLTIEDVKQGPDFKWMIDGMLPDNGFSILVGASNSYKTFFALEMAFCVAGGLPFHGRNVQKGSVVYISAEGRAGIPRRIRGWEVARSKEIEGVLRFCPMAVQMHVPDHVDRFIELVEQEMHPLPSLVIIDTLARCFVGGQENDAQDMGRFVYGVDTIRDRLGTHVLAIHHTGKTSESERGSSALFGAVDTDLFVKRDGRSNNVTVSCKKQKEADEFDPLQLSATSVSLPDGNTSLVLDSEFTGLLQLDRVILNRIRDVKVPMGYAELGEAMKEPDKKRIGRTKLTQRIHALVDWGYIRVEELGQGGKHVFHLTGKMW